MNGIDVTRAATAAAEHAVSASAPANQANDDDAGKPSSQSAPTPATRDGLPRKVVDGIHHSGLLRHFVPENLGGADGQLADTLAPLIQLGRADPSTGWCASLMTSAARMATHLPAAGQRDLWAAGPDVMIAATLRPAGTATPVDGGWLLDGQWLYVSGITHCQWALLSTTSGDEQRFMLVPQKACAIHDTWNAVGMRATGTHTVLVEQTFVPQSHSFTRQQLIQGQHTAGRSVPHEAVFGLFFAAPLLGAAQGMLETWRHLRRTRRGGEHSTSRELGQAVGYLGAAEAMLSHAAHLADTDGLDDEATLRCRVYHATAADLIAQTTAMLFRTGGTVAVDASHPLSRFWRDINTGLMHPALDLPIAAADYARLSQT
ncbi:acyl-CoA dehydrogenase family protein [Actinoplanes sp. G11-F43]|uniref:acyl-CoA dehydrogenase family protein n=1 Tax=Actinoplanes sp. G11-F43 TaxID=3424130 RepID=UPI003D34ABDB